MSLVPAREATRGKELFRRASGHFAVNVLASQQEPFARCFATRSLERYELFCHALYQPGATGSPLLAGALAFLEARIAAGYPAAIT